jgi:hypothetical protein
MIDHRGGRDAARRRTGATGRAECARPCARFVRRSGTLERAVVVAVTPMGVMQVAVDEVVDVVPVRDRLVTAGRAVDVRLVVRAARVRRRACVGVGAADADTVLFDAAAVRVMQVPVVQVVDVALANLSLVAGRFPPPPPAPPMRDRARSR